MAPTRKRSSPSPRTLPWDDLRLLDAIAQARTLPAAAERLGINHSTAFRRLRQVEESLGVPVFERGPGGYSPTAAGTEIVALAARIDEDLSVALRRMAGQAPVPSGEVRIATSDLLLFQLVLPMLAEFRVEFPSIRLDLVTGNTPLNLSRRDADIAIRATDAPPDTLVGRKVARIAWATYAARTLAGKDGGKRLLAEGPWVGFGDALAGLAGAARMREQAPEQAGSRFDTVGGILAGISAGLGIGLLPCFAGDRQPALLRVAPPIAALETELWLLTHPDLRHAPRIRTVLDFLAGRLTALRRLIEGGEPLPKLKKALRTEANLDLVHIAPSRRR